MLSVLAHAGEVVAQSPLLQMAELEDMVCVAEVDATDVQHLNVGQKAVVSSRAFRGPFPETGVEGVIERFGSVVARGGAATPRPTQAGRSPRGSGDRVARFEADVLQLIFGDEVQDPTALVGLQVEVEFPEPASSAASAP